MGKGRQFELDMVRDINSVTDSDMVFCATLDYSGVASDSDADLVLSWWQEREWYALHLIELKKRSGEDGKRFETHPLSGSTPEQDGAKELARLASTGPNHADRWLALKPDHRELVVVNATWLQDYINDDIEGAYFPSWKKPSDDVVEAVSPRLTPGGNVSMTKPSLDVWQSSSAGKDDAIALLDALNIPEQYIE